MIVYGNNGNNVLVGTSGDDSIYGYDGQDTLIGSGGKDYLNGGTGADTMDGGSGDDTYIVDNLGDEVVEYADNGNDTIHASITYSLNLAEHVENLVLTGSADIDGYGDELDNHVYGNSGDNDLWGLNGNDTLKGGGGNDVLFGGAGEDTMLGGTGDDYFLVDDFDDEAIEYSGQGFDTVSASVSYEIGNHIEKLVLTGSANINGYGNALNNEIIGNSGKNYLYGAAGEDTMKGGDGNDRYQVDNAFDKVVEYSGQGIDSVYSSISYTLGAHVEHLYLQGTSNLNGTGNSLDNVLQGNDGNNTLTGHGGHDNLEGGLGADTLIGGEGSDSYSVNEAGDVVVELAGQGTDSVYTSGDINYTLTANVENLYLDVMGHGSGTGNELNNFMWGSINDGYLDGGVGQDTMYGLFGNDSYYVDNTLDLAIESLGQGNNDVYAKVDYTIGDHIETLSLDGGSAVSGTGNAQANTIFGNVGDNILDGGGGADVLSGLGGNDTFVFKAGQAHGDQVYEFQGNGAGLGDTLKFEGYGAGATLTQQTATEWLISSADGSIQDVITLIGAPTLDASDYLFA